MVKHFLQSKTIWFGAATTAVSLLTWLNDQQFIKDNPQAVSVIGMIIGVTTVVLRFMTTTGVSTNGSSS